MRAPIEKLNIEEMEAVNGGFGPDWEKIIHALIDLVVRDHCETDPT